MNIEAVGAVCPPSTHHVEAHAGGVSTKKAGSKPDFAHWIEMYPPELDHLFLEIRKVHAWKLNPINGKAFTFSKYFSIRQARRRPDVVDRYTWQSTGAGYHVHLCRNPVFKRKRGATSAADVACITSLALDLDHVGYQKALALLSFTSLPRPTLVVKSGTGTHLYFSLERPLPMTTGPAVLDRFVRYWKLNPWLRKFVDAGVRDPSRILRIAGINWKAFSPALAFAPTLDEMRAHVDERSISTVVRSCPDAVYALDDLLPDLTRAKLDQIYEVDWTAVPPSSSAPLSMRGKASRRGASACSLPSNPPLSSSSTASHEGGMTWNECDPMDVDFVKTVVERIEVPRPGTRFKTISKYVAALRRTYPFLTMDERSLAHDLWFRRWEPRMSGRHSIEESRAEFHTCWTRMPQQYRTSDDWVATVLANLQTHPLADKLPKGERNASLRKLADVIWTGCKLGGGRCHLSVRMAAKAIGVGRNAAASAIRKLIGLGLIRTVSLGNRATGMASVYEAISLP